MTDKNIAGFCKQHELGLPLNVLVQESESQKSLIYEVNKTESWNVLRISPLPFLGSYRVQSQQILLRY